MNIKKITNQLKSLKVVFKPKAWVNLGKTVWLFVTFFVLIAIFLAKRITSFVKRTPLKFLLKPIEPIWSKSGQPVLKKAESKLDSWRLSEVKRSYLIKLAYQNLKLKQARAIITIGGMALGISAIVFLVSLGYGLEKLVITQVARLEDLRMLDISPGQSKNLRLNDDSMEKIKKVEFVEEAVPMISLVGKVNFKGAVADVLTYAVPQRYLEISQVEVAQGEIFKNNETALANYSGRVAGVETSLQNGVFGRLIRERLRANILPQEAALAWSEPSINAQVLGYVSRQPEGFWADEYWGGAYTSSSGLGRAGIDEAKNQVLGKWFKATLPLWQKNADDQLIPVLDERGYQQYRQVWVNQKHAQVLDHWDFGQVLGEATSSAQVASSSASIQTDSVTPATTSAQSASASAQTQFDTVVVSTDSAGVEWVSLKSSSESAKKTTTQIKFEQKPQAEALVSTGMLRLFNLDPKKAKDQEFGISFILVKSLMPDIDSRVLSEEVKYKITGVVEDDASAYIYIPFIDMRKIGVSNFSQLKVITKDKIRLASVREEVETLGFRTSSTADTVNSIERLFKNVRLLLAILGMVALGVAVLGMFNTLTVSLLERTREIGGMKAMGMLSGEVKDLFLAEAMIMGLTGGVGGLTLGFMAGKGLSLLVSSLAAVRGQGFLNLSYIPPFFSLFILISSFVVGILTGLYPARRATKISALNALRYE